MPSDDLVTNAGQSLSRRSVLGRLGLTAVLVGGSWAWLESKSLVAEADTSYLDLLLGTTPPPPAAGSLRLYADSTANSLYVEAPSGSLAQVFPGFNVKSFGAQGNAGSDDTGAFAAALNAAATAGGASVFIPAGTYMISAQLSVPSNTRIVGEGELSTLKLVPNCPVFNGIFVVKPNVTGVTFQDFVLDGNRFNQSGQTWANGQIGITCQGRRVKVLNVTFRDFWGTGLNTFNVANNFLYDYYVAGCTAQDCNMGFSFTQNIDMRVVGCLAQGNQADGIQLLGCRRSVLLGNVSRFNGGYPNSAIGNGIYLTNTVNSVGNANIVIANNVCYSNGQGSFGTTPTSSHDGIRINDSPNPQAEILVIGNSCFDDFAATRDKLAGAISASQATIPLSTPTLWPSAGGFFVRLSSGEIAGPVTGGWGSSSVTVASRGALGTSAASQAAGSLVAGVQFQAYGVSVLNQSTPSSKSVSGNIVSGNRLGGVRVSATSSDGGTRISGNLGYNPVGQVNTPPIPPSGSAVINTTGVDCMVLLRGGTVTDVAIGGNGTGETTGWFPVPAGQSITLTYSAAPSWAWWGN